MYLFVILILPHQNISQTFLENILLAFYKIISYLTFARCTYYRPLTKWCLNGSCGTLSVRTMVRACCRTDSFDGVHRWMDTFLDLWACKHNWIYWPSKFLLGILIVSFLDPSQNILSRGRYARKINIVKCIKNKANFNEHRTVYKIDFFSILSTTILIIKKLKPKITKYFINVMSKKKIEYRLFFYRLNLIFPTVFLSVVRGWDASPHVPSLWDDPARIK